MMKHWLIALSLAASLAAQAGLTPTYLPYKQGETVLGGELFRHDTALVNRGGIVIFHQWTGISDHERQVARKLAAYGFVVLCADVYGEGVRPATPDACKVEVTKYKSDRALLRARTAAAVEALRAAVQLGDKPVVAIGYCFGGTAALELARAGSDIKAAVSFHGGLDAPQPAVAGAIKARVLALHGADDPYVPAAEVQGFEQEMKAAGVNYRLISYPGAVHSFTLTSAGSNKASGAAYQAEADLASWSELQKILNEVAPRPASAAAAGAATR